MLLNDYPGVKMLSETPIGIIIDIFLEFEVLSTSSSKILTQFVVVVVTVFWKDAPPALTLFARPAGPFLP